MKLHSNYTHQGVLQKQLHHIFPNTEILENVKKDLNFKYDSGKHMELDLWIPKHGICFEFQDSYHYVTTWYSELTHEKIREKDITKQNITNQQGVTLVVIPCWWDGTPETLKSTINFHRPDLFSPTFIDASIALNPPSGFFPSSELPEVGELMLASFPSGSQFVSTIKNNSWWMGEKYDGIRCYWNPNLQRVYGRHGSVFEVLPTLVQYLPNYYLDSELWFGRQRYALSFGLVNGTLSKFKWDTLRMISFDIPSYDFQNEPFELRYYHLLSSISANHNWMMVASRIIAKEARQVRLQSNDIINHGGEGVILRKVGSLYEKGRSFNLIKLKSSRSDGEAIVVARGPKKSLELKLPSGKIFTVQANQIVIPTPNAGDIVSFSYDSFVRKDIPCSPKVYRVRTDVSWGDILKDSQKKESKAISEGPSAAFKKTTHGIWSRKKMRFYLEKIVKNNRLDPLLADSWYSSYSIVYKSKVGRQLIKRTKGGYTNLICTIFPDIKFNIFDFKYSSLNEVSNRRKFFEELAIKNGFDPLIASNWYYFSTTHVKNEKGGSGVLRYHNESVSQALLDLFPDIGLDPFKFGVSVIWANPAKQKMYFKTYATKHHFNYLVPDNWYSLPKIPKAVVRIMKFHNNSLQQTLLDLFGAY